MPLLTPISIPLLFLTDTSIIMPSFFGDDEFSFLDTYRERRVNDEDESDNERSQTSPSSSSITEGNDEQEFVYTSTAVLTYPKVLPHLNSARKIE